MKGWAWSNLTLLPLDWPWTETLGGSHGHGGLMGQGGSQELGLGLWLGLLGGWWYHSVREGSWSTGVVPTP